MAQTENPSRAQILARIKTALASPSAAHAPTTNDPAFAPVANPLERFQKECAGNNSELITTPNLMRERGRNLKGPGRPSRRRNFRAGHSRTPRHGAIVGESQHPLVRAHPQQTADRGMARANPRKRPSLWPKRWWHKRDRC